jgi:hypothetical protein
MRGILKGDGAGGEFMASSSRLLIVKALALGIIGAIGGIPHIWGKRRKIMAGRKIEMSSLDALLRQYHISFRELLDLPEERPGDHRGTGGRG